MSAFCGIFNHYKTVSGRFRPEESNSSIPQESKSNLKKLGGYRSVNQDAAALEQQIHPT